MAFVITCMDLMFDIRKTYFFLQCKCLRNGDLCFHSFHHGFHLHPLVDIYKAADSWTFSFVTTQNDLS